MNFGKKKKKKKPKSHPAGPLGAHAPNPNALAPRARSLGIFPAAAASQTSLSPSRLSLLYSLSRRNLSFPSLSSPLFSLFSHPSHLSQAACGPCRAAAERASRPCAARCRALHRAHQRPLPPRERTAARCPRATRCKPRRAVTRATVSAFIGASIAAMIFPT